MSELINELKIIKKYYTEAEASNRVSIAEAQLDSVINLAKGLEQDLTCTEVESRLRGDRIAELEAKIADMRQRKLNAIKPLAELLGLAVCVESVEGAHNFSDKIRDCTVKIRNALISANLKAEEVK